MDTTKQDPPTEPVNGHLSPDDIFVELNIPCPEHPDELVQRISINNQIEKEVLCVECLISLEDPKTAIPNLVSPGQFIKLAHDFYQKSDKETIEPSQIPSEYQTLLLKQAENIDKVSHHIEKEKKKVEEKYKALIQEFTNLCNQKKEEHLSNLDKQLFNFRYNYVYFEKQLNKVYPSEQDESKPANPTKEALVEKFQKVSNTTQLMTLIKNIKQDLKEANFNPIAPQDNSEETRKKNLDTLAKAMQAQLSQLPTFVPPKFTTEEDVMKGFKENLDKTLAKILEMEKEIFDLTKGENVPSSKVITTPEQLTLLKKWLNKGSLNLKLLYRASKDGFTGTAFHSKCDGIAETITVIKAEGTNKIFGGYLDQAWQTKEAWINSDKCFVFSLTSKEKYVQKSGHEMYAAYGGSSYGPSFGGGYDFHISGKSGGALLYSFEITDLNNFTGGSSFTCEEIEVFQITKDSGFSDGGSISKLGNVISKEVKQKVADYMGVDVNTYKLLYKGSEDGMTPESFHEKCDNQGPTLVFVKVKGSDEVVGGYTSQPWCAKESYALDNEAFIFSIEKELFCPITIAESAIFQTASTGPYFGDDESLVVFKEKQGGKYNVVSNANDCYQEGDVFSNKGLTFEPEEVEVYEVPY